MNSIEASDQRAASFESLELNREMVESNFPALREKYIDKTREDVKNEINTIGTVFRWTLTAGAVAAAAAVCLATFGAGAAVVAAFPVGIAAVALAAVATGVLIYRHQKMKEYGIVTDTGSELARGGVIATAGLIGTLAVGAFLGLLFSAAKKEEKDQNQRQVPGERQQQRPEVTHHYHYRDHYRDSGLSDVLFNMWLFDKLTQPRREERVVYVIGSRQAGNEVNVPENRASGRPSLGWFNADLQFVGNQATKEAHYVDLSKAARLYKGDMVKADQVRKYIESRAIVSRLPTYDEVVGRSSPQPSAPPYEAAV